MSPPGCSFQSWTRGQCHIPRGAWLERLPSWATHKLTGLWSRLAGVVSGCRATGAVSAEHREGVRWAAGRWGLRAAALGWLSCVTSPSSQDPGAAISVWDLSLPLCCHPRPPESLLLHCCQLCSSLVLPVPLGNPAFGFLAASQCSHSSTRE